MKKIFNISLLLILFSCLSVAVQAQTDSSKAGGFRRGRMGAMRNLTPEQRKQIKSRIDSMTPEQKQAAKEGIKQMRERVKNMTPEQKAAAKEQMKEMKQKFDSLPPEQKEKLKQKMQQRMSKDTTKKS